MDMASDTSYPLKDIEWLFNNGALRSHDEIVEFNRKKEQEAYREDQFELDEIYYTTRAEHKRVLLQRLCFFIPFVLVATGWFCVYIWFFPARYLECAAIKLTLSHEPIKTYLCIFPAGRFAGYDGYPVLQLIFNKHFLSSVRQALYEVLHWDLDGGWWYRAGFSLLYIVSFIIVLAVNGLSVVVIDYKEYKRQVQRCSKAGVKTPIPTNLIADSAMYGYFLHSMGSMFSSGKRK